MLKRYVASISTIWILLGSAALPAGCNDSVGGEQLTSSPTPAPTPDDLSPTPAASPTPGPESSPTPPPGPTPVPTADDWFRISELLVGDTTEGIDLDGDGQIDNSIAATLEVINQTLYALIETAVCGDQKCTAQEQAALKAIQETLDSVFSAQGLSDAINDPIQAGSKNYLMNVLENGASWGFTWCGGTEVAGGYASSGCFGPVGGGLYQGVLYLGPTVLTVGLEYVDPQTGATLYSPLPLYNAYVKIPHYSHTRLVNAILGGGITLDTLIGLVDLGVQTVNESLEAAGLDPIDAATVEDAVRTALTPAADLDFDHDGTGDAFSIGLVAQAGAVNVVN